MKNKDTKPVNYYVRFLHRNIGFFIFGFVLIYGTSGIALIFRDSAFLKHEKIITVLLPAETIPQNIGQVLKLKEFKVIKTEGDLTYFQGGSFNKATGETEYKVKELIFPFNRLTSLHKTPSKSPFHWFTMTFGILMLFMALSSFWMFNFRSAIFRKGLFVALAGIIFAVLILVLAK